MGLIEDITNMKNSGYTDEQIAVALQEQGISPRDINDAFNQSQIKSAVLDQPQQPYGYSQAPPQMSPYGYPPTNQQMGPYGYNQRQNPESMMPSILGPEQELDENGIPVQAAYPPQPEEQPYPGQEQYPNQYQQYPQDYSQGGYPQEYGEYPQEASYPSTGFDTGSIIEISEQVFAEKVFELNKRIEVFNEFKTVAQARIDQMTTRLQKIESIIDKLQASILEKVGSYGDDLRGIKKEMSMMQDSFGKAINPILEGTERKHSRSYESSEDSATHAGSKKK